MSYVCLREMDATHAMIIESPQAPKCIRTGLTGNGIVYTLQEFSDLLDHVNPHIVSPTIPLSGTTKDAAFMRAIKSLRI